MTDPSFGELLAEALPAPFSGWTSRAARPRSVYSPPAPFPAHRRPRRGYLAPSPSSRPSAATAGELVMNSSTPSSGALITSCVRAPSMLLTLPST